MPEINPHMIEATFMDECFFLKTYKGEDVSGRETHPGYYVKFPDGYEIWAPKDVFEEILQEKGIYLAK